VDKENPTETATARAESYWHAQRYKLNNATALLQQSLELFLKARIAEVSPFLLILGDPQSWKKPKAGGAIDFSSLRTLDAVHLCKVADTVCASQLPEKFCQFYGRLRTTRNKITHLNAGNLRVEAGHVVLDILTGFKLLFPGESWVDFRRKYMMSTGQYAPSDDYSEDVTHSSLIPELVAAINVIAPRHIWEFFQYDTKKRGMRCPECRDRRTKWDDFEPTFAQRQKNGTIRCIACATTYTADDYAAKMSE
jgi:hypothetical protein